MKSLKDEAGYEEAQAEPTSGPSPACPWPRRQRQP